MKFLLTIPIRFYWWLIPKDKRRKCLYKISCSNHVFEQTQKYGLKAGLKALNYRWRNCRSGYVLFEIMNEKYIKTVRNEIIREDELNKKIIL